MRATGHAAVRLAGIVGLLLILTPLISISGQSIDRLSGAVVDSLTGAAIANAVVSVQNTSYQVETDESGRFSLPNLPTGDYAIVARAPGYVKAEIFGVSVVEDICTDISIRLEPIVHLVDSIIVIGDRESDAWDNSTVLTKQAIEERRPHDLSDLLESVEGIQINRTGGTNGQALVSIRGSSPEHVLVLIDGQRANSAGNGIIDLNAIPIDMVERVEIHRGGASARYGADALAGVINIVTQPQSVPLALSGNTISETRRWGGRRIGAQLSDVFPVKGLATRLSIANERAEGNFDYNYAVQPSNNVYSGTRLNNAVESQNYSFSARYDYSATNQLSFSSQWYDNTGGLPGPASAPTPDAKKTDERRMLNVLWKKQLNRMLVLETRGGISRYAQSFVDTATISPLNRFNTEYINDAFSVESGLYGEFDFTRGQIGIQLRRDEFSQTDFQRPGYSMGDSRRDVAGLYTTVSQRADISWLKLFRTATVDVAFRVDHAATHKDSTSLLDMTHAHDITSYSPKIGFSLSNTGKFAYSIHTNYGKSFRLPPINALFWQGDAYTRGNPGLRPERAEHSEVGAELNFTHGMISSRFSSTYFHQFVNDLIVWAQGQGGAWQPYNLAAAQLTGHEDAISLSFWDQTIVLRYANTVTTSRNRVPGHVTYDKELTFTPRYIQSLSARLDVDYLFGSITTRSVGRRYALENNQKFYDAYSVVDFGVGGRLSLSRLWRVELSYDVNNVSDEDYVLIAHYPMPGREWRARLKIEFGPGR